MRARRRIFDTERSLADSRIRSRRQERPFEQCLTLATSVMASAAAATVTTAPVILRASLPAPPLDGESPD